jgi:hypothetical protein
MAKAIRVAIFALSVTSLANAAGACPAVLVSGGAEQDGISVTFRNIGKLPIRRLEFNCDVMRARLGEPRRQLHCREDNALFYPGIEYTVKYPHPDRTPRPVVVSLKSVMTSDGNFWKASKSGVCGTLTIEPPATARHNRARIPPK